jgi:glutamine amidotransferase
LSPRVAIVNSRVSNLRNITKAVAHLGADLFVTDSPDELAKADKVILPGVGAFSAGMAGLREKGLDEGLARFVRSGRPFLGICLGMQLLLDKSEEFGEHRGLGLVPGSVRRLPAANAKVPHVGWDAVSVVKDDAVLGLEKGQSPAFYFTHSYAVYPDEPSVVVGSADSGYGPYCALLRRENVFASQFHLELSGARGLRMLKGFLDA